LVFDAAINVRDLDAQYNIALPEDPSYESVGGFVLSRLGLIPRGGESFVDGGFRFTVIEMDRRRVSRVKIQRLPQAAGQTTAPTEQNVGRISETHETEREEQHHAASQHGIHPTSKEPRTK
jgi:Mg2+/Co2+ transporter CorC